MLKLFILSFMALLTFESNLFSKTINIDEIVKNTNKEVIVYLHKIGCSYCNSMEEFTLDDDAVKEYIQEHYKFISINVSLEDRIIYKGKETGGKCFAKDVGYAFYPAILFLDRDAKIKYVSLGYKDEFEFLVILKYVYEGFYKDISLDEFKEKEGFTKDTESEITDKRKDAR